jgi:WD40 repeat protein
VLLIGTEDGTILIYEADTLKIYTKLLGHEAMIRNLQWSPVGTIIASAGEDAKNILWNLTTGMRSTAVYHLAPINTLLFITQTSWVVVGDNNGDVIMWDIQKSFEPWIAIPKS